MLRLLAFLMALLTSAPAGVPATQPSVPDDEPHGGESMVLLFDNSERWERGPRTVLVFDASHLPKPTGWFAIPLQVTDDADVEVNTRVKLPVQGDGDAAFTGLVLFPDHHGAQGRGHAAATRAGFLQANSEERLVACCPDPAFPVGGYGHVLEDNDTSYGRARAGDTVWVGLAAVNWASDAKLRITVTIDGAYASVGETRKGTDVRLVDLQRAAYEAGRNVQLGRDGFLGEAGDVSLRFEPQGTGLVDLAYHVDGSAGLTLTVETPRTSPMHHRPVAQEAGRVSLAERGPILVEVADLRETGSPLGLRGDGGWVMATLLYADLDLPARPPIVWTHSTAPVEEDW